MRRGVVAAGAAALVGVVLVAGCSHSSNSSGSSGSLRGAADGGGAAAPAVGATPEAAGGFSADASGKQATPVDLTDPRSLIRTADLQVTVARGTSVAAQADRAASLVVAAGGEVFADDRTAGDAPTASMTLKVPPRQMTTVLGKLSALGEEKSRQLSTRDVTSEVADVTSRVDSARRAIERLRLLYDKATKISDIIAIESELGQREADLESLEAQQRSLAAQVSMATIQLTLTSAGAVPVTHHQDKGFLGGLAAGWRHFTASASWVAMAVGALLPFLVLFALIGAGVIAVRRRTRQVPPVATAGPPPDQV